MWLELKHRSTVWEKDPMTKPTLITRLALVSILLLWLSLLPTTNPAQATPTLGGGVVINEIRIDMPSTDNDEYFELFGAPDQSLDRQSAR